MAVDTESASGEGGVSRGLDGEVGYVPKYAELAEELLRRIVSERLQPGDRLATELELVAEHRVSRPTVRQALALLEQKGFIDRRKKRGTFVRKAVPRVKPTSVDNGTVVMMCPANEGARPDEDHALAHALHAVDQTLGAHGFSLLILTLSSEPRAARKRLRALANRSDLVAVISKGNLAEAYRDVLPNVPVVEFAVWYPGRFPSVRVDVAADCCEAIRLLLDHGHRDVALVCGAWLDGLAFAEFANGYRRAFELQGLKYERSLMYHAHPGESLQDLAREVLRRPTRPTAIFAENWRVCAGVLAAVEELNLRIPDDVSLIAYGENSLHVKTPVPITTYVPDIEMVAAKLAEVLELLISGQPLPQEHTTCAGKLIEQESVRPL